MTLTYAPRITLSRATLCVPDAHTSELRGCGMKKVVVTSAARVAVVSFRDSTTSISCDISAGHRAELGVAKAELLQRMGRATWLYPTMVDPLVHFPHLIPSPIVSFKYGAIYWNINFHHCHHVQTILAKHWMVRRGLKNPQSGKLNSFTMALCVGHFLHRRGIMQISKSWLNQASPQISCSPLTAIDDGNTDITLLVYSYFRPHINPISPNQAQI